MHVARPSFAVLSLTIAIECGGSTPPPAAPAGPPVDPATAGTVTAAVSFEGPVPAPQMMRLDGDPKCVQ